MGLWVSGSASIAIRTSIELIVHLSLVMQLLISPIQYNRRLRSAVCLLKLGIRTVLVLVYYAAHDESLFPKKRFCYLVLLSDEIAYFE